MVAYILRFCNTCSCTAALLSLHHDIVIIIIFFLSLLRISYLLLAYYRYLKKSTKLLILLKEIIPLLYSGRIESLHCDTSRPTYGRFNLFLRVFFCFVFVFFVGMGSGFSLIQKLNINH